MNLKKKYVSHIDLNGEIYKSVNEYTKFLNGKCLILADELNNQMKESYITSRVKSQNSIEAKIQGYRSTEGHEYGKVPIIKCLNDLFGVRIILKTPLTFEEIYGFISDKYGKKYKCIDSSKYEYKATHLYLKKDNTTFPWELQIWNDCDRASNFASHKKYKQAYTNWEKENKEGGIQND
ncbi:MAG: hypothetical protein IJL63_06390 [Clostridia bacterium]|nr:hypothetical protein [Clostridia bacterium]